MCSSTTDEISALALTVERLIAQNESVIDEFEEGYTPFSDFVMPASPGIDTADVEAMFAGKSSQ